MENNNILLWLVNLAQEYKKAMEAYQLNKIKKIKKIIAKHFVSFSVTSTYDGSDLYKQYRIVFFNKILINLEGELDNCYNLLTTTLKYKNKIIPLTNDQEELLYYLAVIISEPLFLKFNIK